MKMPLSLIKEHVDLDLPPSKIAELLTLAGLEVDKIEHENPPFSGVVAAKIKEVKKHPFSDHLTFTLVDDGTDLWEVVCGAPNCKVGMSVAFARIGAKIEDADGKVHHIQKATIKGVDSYGMLCSEKELSISSRGEEIMEVMEEITLGEDLAKLFHDPIFEISFTPNLGHCMSALGIARELSAICDKELKIDLPNVQEDRKSSIENKIKVKVEDKKNCLRYSCRLIEGVKVGPSPFWLRTLLERSGFRSINNIVDATNLIMLEYGHPLHAFDFDKVHGGIKVSSLLRPTKFLALDNEERTILENSLVIQDDKEILALAGVIGGKNSAISETTSNVLIESAFFDSISIRKTSRSLILRSESALRFEKGVNSDTLFALKSAISLIQQLAGGKIVKGEIDLSSLDFSPKKIKLRVNRVNDILGTTLDLSIIGNILKRLGFIITKTNEESLVVAIPSYRHDITAEIDLIEEVARIYGYNKIEKHPPYFQSSNLTHCFSYQFEKRCKEILLQENLQEVITCDLISPNDAALCAEPEMPPNSIIRVLHSKSEDQSVLRSSFLPGLLEAAKINIAHQNSDVSIFEIGSLYTKQANEYKEIRGVGFIACGESAPYHFERRPSPLTFLDLKGKIEQFLSLLKVEKLSFKKSSHPTLHPNIQTDILLDEIKSGVIGEIHPDIISHFDIKQKVFFGEINLGLIVEAKKIVTKYMALPLFPSSERDWTITMPEDLSLDQIIKAVHLVGSPILEELLLLDIYRDPELAGLKNLTLRFTYRDKNKTLAFDEVEKEHRRIINNVQKNLKLES